MYFSGPTANVMYEFMNISNLRGKPRICSKSVENHVRIMYTNCTKKIRNYTKSHDKVRKAKTNEKA